jgi:hypothetical protein
LAASTLQKSAPSIAQARSFGLGAVLPSAALERDWPERWLSNRVFISFPRVMQKVLPFGPFAAASSMRAARELIRSA